MSVKNEHITGDNKGYASYYVEKEKSNNGKNKYIAAFAQSNPGDVTPNLTLRWNT